MEDYIVSILVTLFITGIVYGFLKYYNSYSSQNNSIISTIQDGKKEVIYSGDIPLSKDQADGLGFSYIGWVYINDYTYRYGEKKIVFVKGTPDLSIACPSLVLDSQTNTFLIYIDTFGTQEIIPISNLTAQKWIHFAIVVNQTSANIYINGTLHTHHTMNQLPKQNHAKLIINPNGGFDGKIGYLQYLPQILNPSDISNLFMNPPVETQNGIGILPPYQDTKWWLGRFDSRSNR
jgi:hypothetical protein